MAPMLSGHQKLSAREQAPLYPLVPLNMQAYGYTSRKGWVRVFTNSI